MTIAEYKEATEKLNEFVVWSRKNYTRTPKKIVVNIEVFATETAFSLHKLSLAANKCAFEFQEFHKAMRQLKKR